MLHTWNQKPHIHCVIPAGGLSLDHTHWIKSSQAFFLPGKVLSRVFRGKFVAALTCAFREGQLNSSTSRSAFWVAAGVGNASEIVLPSTL